MGLDVYVGSLFRYYTGDWETVIQQAGREMGYEVEIARVPRPKPGLFQRLVEWIRPSDEAALARSIERWRRGLERQVGTNLTWHEGSDVAYFTDKPAWDCYGALLLWASYDELPDAKRAATAADWEEDAAYLAAWRSPASRYRHLIADTELWIPADFAEPVTTKSILGQRITVGSSIRLLAELNDLNRRTWNADEEIRRQWRYDGAEYGAPLEISARFALAIFLDLAAESVRRRLPMKLDY